MGGEEQALAATEEARRVYVGNLLPKAKEIHLTSKFARFGTIHSPPGFAFVRFASPDAAQRAVDACRDGGSVEILGKTVRVQMAGDKDSKHSDDQDPTTGTDRAKTKDHALESRVHCERSRSRSSRRRGRPEDSRGVHRSRSRDRPRQRERRYRRSRSRSRENYRRDRYGERRSRSPSRFRCRSGRISRSRSRSRDRRRHDTARSRSRDRRRHDTARNALVHHVRSQCRRCIG
ncbi:DNA binding protein [Phytophthora megakarya]|uniref:DNA binding protein n=1 Tax=Phytophthora megakarya TaxID=4795 RepID=A0A225X4G8_9STRA|nr:DNA binding protein [Phytophthora megakarya]